MKDKVLKISKKLGLSHIGSCLSVLSILEEVYAHKRIQDKVGLSGAHAHLAHMIVIHNGEAADELIELSIKLHGIHCDRKAGCDITGGSLGHSGIALGMALADPEIDVYWIETDGSLNEGSTWEMLRLKNILKAKNLKVYVNINGFTALEKIDKAYLAKRLYAFDPHIRMFYTNNGLPELEGVKGHYLVL